MFKVINLAMLAALCFPLANASNTCMVMMVSGVADPYGISVTFRSAGKLPIRRLELNCSPIPPQAHKTKSTLCHAENGLFFPGTEYTVSFPHPGGLSRPAAVSLKGAILSDGYVWKPVPAQRCRILKIYPRKGKIAQ